MKKIFLLVLMFSFSSIAIFAGELKSELVIEQDATNLNSGEFVSATIRLWPIENPAIDDFKKIEGQTMFGGLYVNEIESMNPSENNGEVFEVKVSAILTGNISQEKLFLNYQGHEIPVKFQKTEIKLIQNKNKDFYVLSQGLDLKYKIWIFVILFIVLVVFCAFVFKGQLKNLFSKKVKGDPRLKYKTLFATAHSREDFEKIYSDKEEWIPSLVAMTSAHQNFFNTLNQYQYKKNWTHEDLVEVETSFEFIRRSFE